jgi:hypothetical protein
MPTILYIMILKKISIVKKISDQITPLPPTYDVIVSPPPTFHLMLIVGSPPPPDNSVSAVPSPPPS